MSILDLDHTWRLLIDGVDYTENIATDKEFKWTEGEGRRLSVLSLTLINVPTDTIFSSWQEIQLISDPDTANEEYQFGGYILRPKPFRHGATTERGWTIRAEGYNLRLSKSHITPNVYLGWYAGKILEDVWKNAGLTDWNFDLVQDGQILEEFVVSANENLFKIMERLRILMGDWSWGINNAKQVWFWPATEDSDDSSAPFSVGDMQSDIDYSTRFPIKKKTISVKRTGEKVFNRVSIIGGESVSDLITVSFKGSDGTTRDDGDIVFNLPDQNLAEFVSCRQNSHEFVGTYEWGSDWYDTDPKIKAFGHLTPGTVRFVAGIVEATDDIIIKYRKRVKISVTRKNQTLYERIGFWLDAPDVYDSSIVTEEAAAEFGDKLLGIHSQDEISGKLNIQRLGLHAGQRVHIKSDTYLLDGYFIIQSITNTVTKKSANGKVVESSVTFGRDPVAFSTYFDRGANTDNLATPYGRPASVKIEGEVGIMRFRDRWEALLAGTEFNGWNDYGNATGIVGGVDPLDGYGKILGLLEGEKQAYFGGDGRLYGGGGRVRLGKEGLNLHDTEAETGYGKGGYGFGGYGGVTSPVFIFTKKGSDERFAIFRSNSDDLIIGWSPNNGNDGYAIRWRFGKNRTFRLNIPDETPASPAEAEIAWANGVDWNPGAGKGLYAYNGTSWEKLSPSDTIGNTPMQTQNLVDASVIQWDLDAGGAATVTLQGNRTLSNPDNMKNGGTYFLIIKQDTTGSRTLDFGSAYKFPDATAPTLSSDASATDILTFISDGSYMYAVAQLNFG